MNRREPRIIGRAGAIGISLLILGACGGERDSETRLNLTLLNPVSADEATFVLTCDPPGGNAANAANLCRDLRDHSDQMLPAEAVYTCPGEFHSRYLGIEGTFEGEQVETAIALCNEDAAERLWQRHLEAAIRSL